MRDWEYTQTHNAWDANQSIAPQSLLTGVTHVAPQQVLTGGTLVNYMGAPQGSRTFSAADLGR